MCAAVEGEMRIVQPHPADLAAGIGAKGQRGGLRIIETAQDNSCAVQLHSPVVHADRAVEPRSFKHQTIGETPGEPVQVERDRATVRRGKTGLVVCHATGEGHRVGAIVGKETRIQQAWKSAPRPMSRVGKIARSVLPTDLIRKSL